MSVLTKEVAVQIYGTPIEQGSMTCVGFAGHHNIQPSNKKALMPWRDLVKKAGEALPVTGLAGPLGVEVTLTVARPKSVTRDWPSKKANRRGAGGDIDKLARAVLDGLTLSKVFGDDSQVVELTARKCYPDSPGATDALDRPGALIRIYPIGA